MWYRHALASFLSLSLLTLNACGGGGGGGGAPAAPTYSIGVTVSGLSGAGLVLQNNAGDNLSVTASGSVSFAGRLGDGASYGVTVLTQPSSPSQTCSVTDGAGSVAGANVTTVTVNCVTNIYTVGGSVAGLTGNSVVLQNNAGDNLTVSANGMFSFATPVNSGAPYAVTVLTHPASPPLTCVVASGAGTVGGGNVTHVAVTCATPAYAIGGNVSGLAGSGLVLRNNGGDDKAISANGSFTFATPVVLGGTYNVTIATQPSSPTQTCSVTNGTGTVGGNVGNVAITCVTNSYTIGGSVSGLAGSGLVLRNNGGNSLAVSANGSFTFSSAILSGAGYAVTVFAQPSSPTQTCSVTYGSGTVGGANVTNVSIACVTNTYTIGGSVSGLSGSGMYLQNNGSNLAIGTNGSFVFAIPVASGATYTVTTNIQPSTPAQTCAVTNGTGTVGAANVTNVTVTCSPWTKQLGSTDADVGHAVAADVSGNIILAGYTKGNYDGNLSSNGDDALVTRYAANANKSWSVQFGSNIEDQANGVATDSSGNIYVVGYTNGVLDGGSGFGVYDIFVTKYNAAGVRQWIRQLGTTQSEKANAVAVDGSGNVYVAGNTAGGLDGHTNAGSSDAFLKSDAYLTKYDTNGTKQWTRQLGAIDEDVANGVAVDTSGNILVAGYTEGNLDGNTSAGSKDMFVAKYDSSGTKLWTRQLGSAVIDVGRGVATDSSGNVYVAGYTDGNMDGNVLAGVTDGFITKYDSSGAKQWTTQFGGPADDAAFAIAVDSGANIYVTGYTKGALTASPNPVPGVNDVFVAKYNAGGARLWISQFGTADAETAFGVATDGSGNIFIAGSTAAGLDGHINAGLDDVFLVKYNASGVKQ
jgi:hypothetical protein